MRRFAEWWRDLFRGLFHHESMTSPGAGDLSTQRQKMSRSIWLARATSAAAKLEVKEDEFI